MLLKKLDQSGKWVKDVILEKHPQTEVEGKLVNDPLYRVEPYAGGLYWPKFDFETGTWVEALTQEEIDMIVNTPQEPTEFEALKSQMSTMEEAINFMLINNL